MRTRSILASLLVLLLWSSLSQAITPETFNQLMGRALRGETDAQYALATKYALGEGVEKNLTEALKWYTKAAEKGDTKALTKLAIIYYYGQFVPQDKAAAREWYRRSAAVSYTHLTLPTSDLV